MKKIIYLLISVLVLQSCTKDITRFNEHTKAAADVPAGTLVAYATKSLSDVYASGSVNTNIWRFTVKHWAMGTYQDEVQYNFTTRSIPDGWWNTMYRNVLNNFQDAGRIITENTVLDPVVKANQLAIIEVMQVYTYKILVNTFGDVPYTEALRPDILFPKYDDAKTIYADLLKRLAASIAKLNATSGSFTANEDLIFKGDVSKWIKFANSLQMQMGMIIADVDNAAAQAAVQSANANSMASSGDNAFFKYKVGSPNQNPLYVDIILGGRPDYVASEELMGKLISLNDPRKAQFFGKNNDGNYVGGVVGANNTFSAMSKPSLKVSAEDGPVIFMSYAQTEFLRAEAIERGYTIPGTAAEHYNNAITASILDWGGTAAEATAYLAQPEVAYATATGAWKQKIGFQKWIALYNQSFDGWTELRRFDFPVLTAPVGAKSGFPNRFSYPGIEQQVNGTNYTAAAAKMGDDKVEFKLFWDKF